MRYNKGLLDNQGLKRNASWGLLLVMNEALKVYMGPVMGIPQTSELTYNSMASAH